MPSLEIEPRSEHFVSQSGEVVKSEPRAQSRKVVQPANQAAEDLTHPLGLTMHTAERKLVTCASDTRAGRVADRDYQVVC